MFKITCFGDFLLLVGALGWVFYTELAAASGSAHITHNGNTDVGKILQNKEVRQAIEDADALTPGFSGSVDAAAPDSPWGIGSAGYTANIFGDIVAVVHNANPGRIFGAIELKEALANSKVIKTV
ncbi:hypothetical protein GN278_17255 [Rhodobacteraceae bacterium Araon29]